MTKARIRRKCKTCVVARRIGGCLFGCNPMEKLARELDALMVTSSAERHPIEAYSFGMIDDSVFAFAGLWERWRSPAGEIIETCTILTTQPNGLVAPIHNRMPVILKPEDYDLWLNPGVVDPGRITACLQPFDARLMKKYPVSSRVNSSENDDPACAEEMPLPGPAPTLF